MVEKGIEPIPKKTDKEFAEILPRFLNVSTAILKWTDESYDQQLCACVNAKRNINTHHGGWELQIGFSEFCKKWRGELMARAITISSISLKVQ